MRKVPKKKKIEQEKDGKKRKAGKAKRLVVDREGWEKKKKLIVEGQGV